MEEKNPDESTVTIEETPKKSKKKKERPPPDPSDPTFIAQRAAVHTAEATAEAEAKLRAESETKPSKLEECKYYTSLVLGTLCIVSVFAFLFLIPFVLDPAISTMIHDFTEIPATCAVTNVSILNGKTNCSWSSCREGCTAELYHCYQVRVKYSHQEFKEGRKDYEIPKDKWIDLERLERVEINGTIEERLMYDTPLLVNIKGCGYPPDIACPRFASRYNDTWFNNQTFPCYYSRVNPWIVLETYEPSEMIGSIIASVTVPNFIFLISLIVLLYWYCPYCQARCHKYDEQIDQEEKDEDEMDMEDEENPDRF